tara:strand:+ start:166 stop:627 length:462 start_codon:yes stop_codon:yes gene_type:complete
MSSNQTIDWLLRVGDGKNFINSSEKQIWGISSKASGKYFTENVKPGDRLWFVTSKSKGKLLAVATHRSHNKREIGPLINISKTDEELGWTGSETDWKSDIEIHYTDLYGLNSLELLTHIKSPLTIRKYNEKCSVNLEVEYSHIVRYSKVTFEL